MKKKLKNNRQRIFQVIFIIIAVLLFNTIYIIPNAFAEKIETPQGTIYKPDAQGFYPAVVLLQSIKNSPISVNHIRINFEQLQIVLAESFVFFKKGA